MTADENSGTKNIDLSGLGVALITPFKQDMSIDFKSLESMIEHVIKGGVDYIVALGTTAETPNLSSEEKDEVAQFIREKVAERVPLVIGIGGNNTMRVVRNLNNRKIEGYSAVLSVTPYYNKPTQEGLYQHFKVISQASPLPVILYNVPGRTGVNLSAKTTLKLAQECHNIKGIKEASGNMEQCREIIEGAPKGFDVISGNDGDTAEIIRLGGCGVISVMANALPEEMKKLLSLCEKRKFDEAHAFQSSLSGIINSLFEDGNPAGVKALLSKMGMVENILRLPLTPVGERVSQKIDKAMQAFLVEKE